jgi:hypothetical protein
VELGGAGWSSASTLQALLPLSHAFIPFCFRLFFQMEFHIFSQASLDHDSPTMAIHIAGMMDAFTTLCLFVEMGVLLTFCL